MSFQSVEEICRICSEKNMSFPQVVCTYDADEQGISTEASRRQMQYVWEAMKDSIESYSPDMRSKSGMVGSEGGVMAEYAAAGNTLCGPFVTLVMSRALMMGCSNACMGRIVAAPTAGACGVIPAVLYSCYTEKICSEEQIIDALYVAGGIGQVIANRASIAGASGGCQAEIGSASAMAAAALVCVKGGSIEQMVNASAMALKNLLGLVCDPVGGFVEVPCVKRNVIGAVNALTAADMALAGVCSVIPADQVIDAMREVGDSMDISLKETARGGVAASPRAMEILEGLKKR